MSIDKASLKARLLSGEPTYGLWVTLESATISEIAASVGFDWIVIDTEHGHLDFREVLDHLRAVTGSGMAALVRIPEIEEGTIKRVLDLGADGIVVPQVLGAEDVRRAVRYAKYPPRGSRGVGGERSTRWGLDLARATRSANDRTIVIPIIENLAGADAIGEILEVEGVDAVFFGPADLSASAGFLGDWEGPGVGERILDLLGKVRAGGLSGGILATSAADALRRREQGFRMIGLGSDTGMLIRSFSSALEALGAGSQGVREEQR